MVNVAMNPNKGKRNSVIPRNGPFTSLVRMKKPAALEETAKNAVIELENRDKHQVPIFEKGQLQF